MTPAGHWNEADYYAARDAARRAWENSNDQLSILSDSPALALIGLESGEVERADAVSAAASPVSSPPSPAVSSSTSSPVGEAGSTPITEGD